MTENSGESVPHIIRPAEEARTARKAAAARMAGEAATAEVERQERVERQAVEVIMQARDYIDAAIAKGEGVVTMIYSERISATTNPRERVDEIIQFAQDVGKVVHDNLSGAGYSVLMSSKEQLDYRQHEGEPPEYYDTTILVNM